MPSLGNLFFKIGADVSEATKGIKKVGEELEKIKRISLFSAVIQGSNAAISTFKSIAGAVRPLIEEYDRAAKASEKLRVALKGDVQGVIELKEQANKLAGIALFSSDTITNAQATLASLGLTSTAIQKLIPLVEDFASAQKLDLVTAAQAVGKTILNGGNALNKYGVNIKNAYTGTQRFTAVVNELGRSFQGQAAAAAQAGAGPLQLLEQRFSNIKEVAGEALVRFVNVFLPEANKGIDKLSEVIASVPEKFENIAKSIKKLEPLFNALAFIVNAPQKAFDFFAKDVDKSFDSVTKTIQRFRDSGYGKNLVDRSKLFTDGTKPTVDTPKQGDTALERLRKQRERLLETLGPLDVFSKKYASTLKQLSTVETDITNIEAKRAGVLDQTDSKTRALADDSVANLVNKFEELNKANKASNLILLDANALDGANQTLLDERAEKLNELKIKYLQLFEAIRTGPGPGEAFPSQEDIALMDQYVDKITNAEGQQVKRPNKLGLLSGVNSEDSAKLTDIYSTKGPEAYTAAVQTMNDKINNTNDLLLGIGAAAGQAFGGLVSELASGQLAFKNLGLAALKAAGQIIKAALAEAVAAAIAGSLKNSFNVIAGLALAAVAVGVVTALFASKVPKLARGGLVTRPTVAIVGDNPGAGSGDPEVISPLSKLQGMLTHQINSLAALLTSQFNDSLSAMQFPEQLSPSLLQSLEFNPHPSEITVKGHIDGSVIRLSYDKEASIHNRHQPKNK